MFIVFNLDNLANKLGTERPMLVFLTSKSLLTGEGRGGFVLLHDSTRALDVSS